MIREVSTYLPDDILAKVDRAAMAVSLETRVPMLDPELFAFAHSLPLGLKSTRQSNKRVLRHLLARHVPSTLWDREKVGFSAPIASWLRGPLKPWASELLSPNALAQHGLLSEPTVRRIWDEHQDGRRNWAGRLWNVLMFQAWYDEWMASN